MALRHPRTEGTITVVATGLLRREKEFQYPIPRQFWGVFASPTPASDCLNEVLAAKPQVQMQALAY